MLEERARYIAEKVPPTIEKPPETDDKGNVKPPEKPHGSETPADEQHPMQNEFSLFLQMEYAYLEEGDCLSKATGYYEALKSSPGGLIHPHQIEAEYLLSRFRCGDSSALDALKAQIGPTSESFFANAVLGAYYQSIGENQAALQCFQYKFDHAPDSTRKLNSALSLGEFLAEIGKLEDGISLLKGQISYFQSANDHAVLWEAMGKIYASKGLDWRKHLCFEQSLKLNPDNTTLRFALAYSYGGSGYGKVMALHHYEILRKQTPRNSTVANNLSVIYDEVGAATTKISLLRGAQRRKDSAYVSANLATAYAKAGFIGDAQDCLKQVPVGEQQENIVQAAYRTIRDQTESDRQITEKLDRLVHIHKRLIDTEALGGLTKSDEELSQAFIGEWQLGESTEVRITSEAGKLAAGISPENSYYEDARYQVTVEYEPGLLQLDAQLPIRKTPGKSKAAPAVLKLVTTKATNKEKTATSAPKPASMTGPLPPIVTLKHLAEWAGYNHGIPKKQAIEMFAGFVADIGRVLKKGSKIRIPNLGVLQVRIRPARPARKGRNPATGEEIQIKASKASKKVAFRVAKGLSEAI